MYISVDDDLVEVTRERLLCVDETVPLQLLQYYDCSLAGLQFGVLMPSIAGFRCTLGLPVPNVM